MKAIGLCRVSTEEQAAEGRAGLLRQREQIELAARRHGLEILEMVEITDVSGTMVEANPEFRRALNMLADPSIGGVVVADQDRIARPDTFEAFGVFQPFVHYRKMIWTPSDVIDPSEDAGFLRVLLMGGMAGLDRRKILRMTQQGKETNRRRGRCANAKITLPQGVDFDFKTGRWSWVEPHATRIKIVFQMILSDNRSVLSVARNLGYSPERTLYNQLRNPIWTGRRIYSHRRGEKYPSVNGKQADRRKIPRVEPLVVGIDLEPLVSMEDFSKVQEILDGKRGRWVSSRTGESRFESSGLLFCSCGQPMYSKGDVRPGKHDLYFCRSRHPRGAGCGAPAMWREHIDHTLTELVKEIFTKPDAFRTLLEAVGRDQDDASLNEEIRMAETELTRLQNEKRNLLRLAVKGAYDDADEERERRRIDAEVRFWTSKRDGAKRQIAAASTESLRTLAGAIASVFAEFESLSLSDRKRLLRAHVARVEVGRGGITRVALRLPAPVATNCSRTGTDSSPPPA